MVKLGFQFYIFGEEKAVGKKEIVIWEERTFYANQSIPSLEILATISQISPCICGI